MTEPIVFVGIDFDPQPTLVGERIILRPLRADDFDAVFAAASDPLIWAQHPEPTRHERAVFERLFDDAIACNGTLVVEEQAPAAPSRPIIGWSRYYDWSAADRSVCIGYTFLVRRHWGRGTNAAVKRLMLDHAFRSASTVWFHVGTENVRSRKAMEKLGAVLDHETSRDHGGVTHRCVVYRMRV